MRVWTNNDATMLVGCVSSKRSAIENVVFVFQICCSGHSIDSCSCSVLTLFGRSINKRVSCSKSSRVFTESYIQIRSDETTDESKLTTSNSTNGLSCSTNREGITVHPGTFNIIEEDLCKHRIRNDVKRTRVTSSSFCIVIQRVGSLPCRDDLNRTVSTSSTCFSNTSGILSTSSWCCTSTILNVRESQGETSVGRIGLIEQISSVHIHRVSTGEHFLTSSRTPNVSVLVGSRRSRSELSVNSCVRSATSQCLSTIKPLDLNLSTLHPRGNSGTIIVSRLSSTELCTSNSEIVTSSRGNQHHLIINLNILTRNSNSTISHRQSGVTSCVLCAFVDSCSSRSRTIQHTQLTSTVCCSGRTKCTTSDSNVSTTSCSLPESSSSDLNNLSSITIHTVREDKHCIVRSACTITCFNCCCRRGNICNLCIHHRTNTTVSSSKRRTTTSDSFTTLESSNLSSGINTDLSDGFDLHIVGDRACIDKHVRQDSTLCQVSRGDHQTRSCISSRDAWLDSDLIVRDRVVLCKVVCTCVECQFLCVVLKTNTIRCSGTAPFCNHQYTRSSVLSVLGIKNCVSCCCWCGSSESSCCHLLVTILRRNVVGV